MGDKKERERGGESYRGREKDREREGGGKRGRDRERAGYRREIWGGARDHGEGRI